MIKHCVNCGEEFHARATPRRPGGQSYCRPCHGLLNRLWKERRWRLSLIGATSSGLKRLTDHHGERDARSDRALATRSHR